MRNLCWLVCCYLLIPVAAGAQDIIFEDGLEYGHTGRWSYVREGGTPDALRFSDTDLRDPHIFVDTGFPLGCRDVTDDGVAGIVPGFNEEIEASITGDDDGDGLLDSSTLLIFRPFDGTIVDGAVLMSKADCTAPVESTQCTLSADAEPHYLRFDGLLSGPCLEPVVGTLSGYSPAVSLPDLQCFTTRSSVIWMEMNGTPVPLHDAQIGTHDANASIDHTEPGLLMGFLYESDADTILLPDDTPLVGGQPLSSVLPGGNNCCAPGDDRDTLDGNSGWWFYFNWVGDSVPFGP